MQTAAAIQMCSTGNVDENLAQAEHFVAQAAHQGARLAVLPEMFALLGCQHAEKITHQEVEGTGKIQDFLAQTAAKHQIWIVGGTTPLVCTTAGKLRAACLVFDDKGQKMARYDKIHLFDAQLSEQEFYRESATIDPGKQTVVVDTPLGKLGLCVCFDMRFSSIFTELSQKKVEIIAIPAAFTVKTGKAHWEILLRCRALDTLSYVIGAGQSGQHPNGRSTYGHTMIVNPWGDILAQQAEGTGVVAAEIDLKKLYEIRQQLPVVG